MKTLSQSYNSLPNSPNPNKYPKASGLNPEESQRVDHLFERQNKMLSKMQTSSTSKSFLPGGNPQYKFNTSLQSDDIYDDMVNDLRGQQKTMRTDFMDKESKKNVRKFDKGLGLTEDDEDDDEEVKGKKKKKKKKKKGKGGFLHVLRKETGLKKTYNAKEAPYWKYIKDAGYDAGFNAGAILRFGNVIALPQKIRYRVGPLISKNGEEELLVEEMGHLNEIVAGQKKKTPPSSPSTTSSERERRNKKKKKHRSSSSSSRSRSPPKFDQSQMTAITQPYPQSQVQSQPQQTMYTEGPKIIEKHYYYYGYPGGHPEGGYPPGFPGGYGGYGGYPGGYREPSRDNTPPRRQTPPRDNRRRDEPSFSKDDALEKERLKNQMAKEMKKKKAKSHLRQICWAMCYPPLLFREVDETVEQRRQAILAGMSDRLNEFMDFAIDFFLEHCEVPLLDIYNETNSLVIVPGVEKTKLTDQDIQNRGKTILVRMIYVIFDFLGKT